MLYKKVLWSYFFSADPNSAQNSFSLGNAPVVAGATFRIFATAGRFGILELYLSNFSSMPAGYEEKGGLVTGGKMTINNGFVEFFTDSIQQMNGQILTTDDLDSSVAGSCSVLIQLVELV